MKNNHGGKRIPAEGKKLGPAKGQYPLQLIKIACTQEELETILKLSTRQRTERLLNESTH